MTKHKAIIHYIVTKNNSIWLMKSEMQFKLIFEAPKTFGNYSGNVAAVL